MYDWSDLSQIFDTGHTFGCLLPIYLSVFLPCMSNRYFIMVFSVRCLICVTCPICLSVKSVSDTWSVILLTAIWLISPCLIGEISDISIYPEKKADPPLSPQYTITQNANWYPTEWSAPTMDVGGFTFQIYLPTSDIWIRPPPPPSPTHPPSPSPTHPPSPPPPLPLPPPWDGAVYPCPIE